jgi:serine phosphatase RsbU (regulator of sigma subunit)
MEANLTQQIIFTTVAFTFGLLHLVLYLYSRRSRSNLYFALFAFLFAANIFFDFQATLSQSNPGAELTYLRIHRAVMPYNSIFALLFFYSLFNFKIPWQFWAIAPGIMITGFFSVLKPVDNFIYVQIFQITVAVESVRVIVKGIRSRKEGAWIIGLGFLLLLLFSSYDFLLDVNLMHPIYEVTNGYPFGFLFLIISMSIYLARDFAKANKRILEQERQATEQEMKRRLLEAEDARKSKELEEARQLQLSMLPNCVTEIPGLDICLHMEPASEVGGDYYDYQFGQDKTFTIAIGDATGHGMKAGIMVSIIKSLFITEASRMDIPSFFKKCSETIKEMRLGNLYMAMMLVKIQDHKLTASSAGMPPIYIYRAESKTVEEIVLKGMPIGGPGSFQYKATETMLAPGDTILLMSDGFPELFNNENEMLDYPRVKDMYQEAAEKSPDEIVAHLMDAGKKWSNGRPQDDDITFVVVKSK